MILVKPSNILVDHEGRIKLCDFGISGRLVDSQARTRGAGCAAYLSPERIDPERGTYDVRADIWSLGLTLIELATAQFPYSNCKSDFEVCAKILQTEAPQLGVSFPADMQDFVTQCCIKVILERGYFWSRKVLETVILTCKSMHANTLFVHSIALLMIMCLNSTFGSQWTIKKFEFTLLVQSYFEFGPKVHIRTI